VVEAGHANIATQALLCIKTMKQVLVKQICLRKFESARFYVSFVKAKYSMNRRVEQQYKRRN
jgi:hypothetical protein